MISMSSVLLRAVVTLPAVPGTYLSQHGKGRARKNGVHTCMSSTSEITADIRSRTSTFDINALQQLNTLLHKQTGN